ncbi:NAD(P)/FAD-dependent oxidoreductase [Williamsia herbipolensis]|uniref:NAD(P)/FAD-dependent oxidoreductase n=1 Tax=Williamsia herbipolensis TaxID=1603258 RepID=A0AAU4JYI3_9NOCA|nr:NAD(P)/FAD-dependent oxidoreductase [Williamsia herbipolensis]
MPHDDVISVRAHGAGGNRSFDAIVVGGGLGGCSAAAHLAALGHKTLLVERYSILGGSSHVFRRDNEWEFDCGVHYVGDCGPEGEVPRLLRGLGLDEAIGWLPLDPTRFDTVIAPGLEVRTPADWDRYLINLEGAFPEDRAGIRRAVGVLRKLGESLDRTRDTQSYGRFAAAMGRAGWAAPYAFLPYVALLVRCGLSPRTILAMSVQNGALASTPETLSTLGHAIFLQNYVGGGAYYPRGGGQTLAAGFAAVIRANGGEISTNTTVARIRTEGGSVIGVELTGGRHLDAPIVVSDLDPVRTFRDLVGTENLSRRLRLRSRSWTMSKPLINGFFGVAMDLSDIPNTNYFAIPDLSVADSLMSLKRFGERTAGGKGHRDGEAWARDFARSQPMFVQSSSRRDPDYRRAAPLGHGTVEVQTLAPYRPDLWGFDGYDVADREYKRNKQYQRVKEIVLDGMLERMEQAIPGSSSRVLISELGTPATQERYVGNTGGAPFGLAYTPTQMGPMRPGPATSIQGLYLVGTSTPSGPATQGAMVSGQIAAGIIVGRDLNAEVRAGASIHRGEKIDVSSVSADALRASH